MSSNQDSVRRRTVLSATAAVAGFSTLGVTAVGDVRASEKGATITETHLTEVLLTHENTPKSPIAHNDTVALYKVDPAKRETLLHDFVPTSLVDTLVQNDGIVKRSTGTWAEQLETVPTTLYGETNEYAELSGGSQLILAENYSSPAVDVTRDNEDLTVTADGESRTVAAGSETTLELPERSVTVRKPTGSSETTAIRPVVVARNFGTQTIRELKGGN